MDATNGHPSAESSAVLQRASRDRNGKEAPTVALIRAIQRGEGESAWGHLHDRYASELLDYARHQIGRHLQPRVSAADIVQEALLRAVRKLVSLPHVRRGAFRTLLRTDIRRIACEKARKKGQRRNAVVAMVDVRLDPALCRAEDRSASSLIALEEEIQSLHQAIQQLRRIYRRVLIAVDLEERNIEEVSAELGQKQDTTRKQLRRAREKLRHILEVESRRETSREGEARPSR